MVIWKVLDKHFKHIIASINKKKYNNKIINILKDLVKLGVLLNKNKINTKSWV